MIFSGVHPALAFAWRLEDASIQPAQPLRAGAYGRSGMTRLDLHAQAALVRKSARDLLGDDLLAYCIARYSVRQRDVDVALRLVCLSVASAMSSDRPWIHPIVRATVNPARHARSQSSIATEHGVVQSTISKATRRARRELQRMHYEIDHALHPAFVRAGLIGDYCR